MLTRAASPKTETPPASPTTWMTSAPLVPVTITVVGRPRSPPRPGSCGTRPRGPLPLDGNGATGRPRPSGEGVGWQVVDEPVVGLGEHPARLVVEAAVAGGGGVAGERAAAHRRRPEVVDAAAVDGGRVAGEGAVAHRQCPAVGNAAAGPGGVAGERAAGHRRRHRRPTE